MICLQLYVLSVLLPIYASFSKFYHCALENAFISELVSFQYLSVNNIQNKSAPTTAIARDNGLSSVQRQAITKTNAKSLSTSSRGTYFNGIFLEIKKKFTIPSANCTPFFQARCVDVKVHYVKRHFKWFKLSWIVLLLGDNNTNLSRNGTESEMTNQLNLIQLSHYQELHGYCRKSNSCEISRYLVGVVSFISDRMEQWYKNRKSI